LLAGCLEQDPTDAGGAPIEDLQEAVVATYADIVLASYEDSLVEANKLRDALRALVADPSEETLSRARAAWTRARLPYLQTEVYRFYAGPIDDEDGPEGLINAWPMDEAYVDSVVGNPDAGIINHPDLYPEITMDLLLELNEKDGEVNISTGYHAIEFLLWGQDRSADGPGNRPAEDYATAEHADRRGEYLLAAGDLLVRHLEHLVEEWAEGEDNYRREFESQDAAASVEKILTGMGMLSGFELAGERLLVALETRSQEDEHSCFSDTTHNDVVHNALGIRNVWEGGYERFTEGTTVQGRGVENLARMAAPDLAQRLDAQIEKSCERAKEIPVPFDQAIESEEGRASILALVESLEDQAALLAELGSELELDIPITEGG